MLVLEDLEGFDWDEGNRNKNWIGHGVTDAECEEIFFNQPIVVAPDAKHSAEEPRYYVLGQTDAGRRVFLVFTLRGHRIRVISARDMNRNERRQYGLQQGTPE
jgi:uncharacterized protein